MSQWSSIQENKTSCVVYVDSAPILRYRLRQEDRYPRKKKIEIVFFTCSKSMEPQELCEICLKLTIRTSEWCGFVMTWLYNRATSS